MRKLALTVLSTASLLVAGSANAALVVFNFDDLAPNVSVPSNYGGASWSGFQTAANFGATSQPNIAYTLDPTGILDYAAGFTSLTFSAGVFATGTFSVFDGLGGSGNLLGTLVIGDPPASPFAFFQTGVAFSGIGKSVVVTGGAGLIGWDDVTLNTSVVPEPASLALVIGALGVVGLGKHRRRSTVTA